MKTDTPWTRLEKETTLAYSAFAEYRDLGPVRSYSKVCEKLDKAPGYKRQIETWSQKYYWVYRATTYDDHLDKLKLVQAESNIVELQEQALTGAKKALDRLINIAANRHYCENYELKAIELLLRSVGLVQRDSFIKEKIKALEKEVRNFDINSVIDRYLKR